MLSEPFFTAEECSNLNWPDDESTIDDEEVWDNEDIRSILRKFQYIYLMFTYSLTDVYI
jgi:hypothetical protein